MKPQERSVFYVSDHTALTAENLGRSIIAQFPGIHWNQRAMPYIADRQAALNAVREINEKAKADGCAPLVVNTLLNRDLSDILSTSDGYILDIFRTFLPGLEEKIGSPASTLVGAQSAPTPAYSNRIEAIQYSMEHDDGCRPEHFDQADIVLLGVSRTGKTPTCLYIAIQFGLRAANYPLAESDLASQQLPPMIEALKDRLFGLTIEAETLSDIRRQRWPNSTYAEPGTCLREIEDLREIYRRYGIPTADVTRLSIEEVAAQALEKLNINRTAELGQTSP